MAVGKGQRNFRGVYSQCQVSYLRDRNACLWEHTIKTSLMNLKCMLVKMKSGSFFMLGAGKYVDYISQK